MPAADKACRGFGVQKNPFQHDCRNRFIRGFKKYKKALALFRAHLWFDYLLSPLPKVDTLITFHRKRGEKRAGLYLNVIPCRGIFFSGLSRKVYPGAMKPSRSLFR